MVQHYILVADDNSVFRKIITRQIKNCGHLTQEVTNGEEAIAALQKHPNRFSLIFLDQSMPTLSGMETFLEMQETIANLPPVIMITAHDSLNLALSFIKAGGFDFLVKPLDPDIVEAKINKAILQQQTPEQLTPKADPDAWLSDLSKTLAVFKLTREKLFLSVSFSDLLLLPKTASKKQQWDQFFASLPESTQKQLARPGKAGITHLEHCQIRCGDQKLRPFLLYYTSQQHDPQNWYGCLLPNPKELSPPQTESPADFNQLLHKLQNPSAIWQRQQFLAANPPLAQLLVNHTIRSQEQLTNLMNGKGYQHHALSFGAQELWVFEQVTEPESISPSVAKYRDRLGLIIGRSEAMQSVYQKIVDTSKTDAGIVIYGESGTGKELTARTIHHLSHRSSGPFVAVNCGAIPVNLFESEFFGHRKGAFTGATQDKVGYFDLAHRGTLFLDEIGELNLENQVKLLRALDKYGYIPVGGMTTVKADIRILAATNRDLTEMLRTGLFREDLFYRINVIQIHLPPLRDRIGDIPILIDHLLTNLTSNKPKPLNSKQLQALTNHTWPGNVRELINVLNRFNSTGAVEFTPTSQHQQNTSNPVEPLAEAMLAHERKLILNALNLNEWHRGRTAESLNIPERTLRRKMTTHKLK